MKIGQSVSGITCLVILLFSYFIGFAQADSTRLDLKSINYFDSIALDLETIKSPGARDFIGGSPFFGRYNGKAILGRDEDRAMILSIPFAFIKLAVKIYGYKGNSIKIYENQDYYYHFGTVYFDKAGLRVESKEILDRLREYSDIYRSLLPIFFQ